MAPHGVRSTRCDAALWVAAAIWVAIARPVPAAAGLEEPLWVVDSPTAGLLLDGEYAIQSRVGPESAISLGFRIGFMDRLQLGASFGMQRVFERDDVSVNDQVGFQVRVRLIEEFATPAVAVGINSQGVGPYDERAERYERKSRGFYIVLSRNSALALGELSLHGGVNMSLERDDDDDPDLFAAADWTPVPGLSLLLDLDAALNDNIDDGRYGGGGVYLDGAVRVRYGNNLSLMLMFRDLTGNFEPSRRVGREFELTFVRSF